MKKIILIIYSILALHLIAFSNTDYGFDIKIHGKGDKNMIMLPGWGCSGDVWNETIEHLGDGYMCYIFTMPGFGGVVPESSPNLNEWVNSIASYIKEYKIEKPVVIGHSIGGGIAMMLAAEYPGLISKIIVVDALPCVAALNNPVFKSAENPDCSAYIQQFSSMNDEQFYQMQKSTMASLMSDTAHRKEVMNWTLNSDRNTLAEIFCQYLNNDMRELISNISCPALILLESPFKNIQQVISDQFKNMKAATIEYSNKGLHFIMYDDKEWYLRQIDNFLK